MFKTNVGGIDRIVRILAGLALLGLTLTGAIGAWGWIGLVPLAAHTLLFDGSGRALSPH